MLKDDRMVEYNTLNLHDVVANIRANIAEVQERYVPLRLDQLRWSPTTMGWSVGQCLHHLVVTDGLYLDRLGPALDRARQHGPMGDGPYRGGWFGRWFTAQVGPHVGMKLRAPRSLAPQQATLISEDVPQAFVQNGERLLVFIARARGLDLHRINIGWPIAPLIRLRVIDVLRAIVAHDRRHLDQARRVTEESDFPLGAERRRST